MMVLEQKKYKDPLKVLLDEESLTCKGCIHELKDNAFGTEVWICTTKDDKDKRRNHGERCKNYRERE